MKFINKNLQKDRNFPHVKDLILKSILDKLIIYTPTNDLREVQEIEFKTDLTPQEKAQLLALFPELREV